MPLWPVMLNVCGRRCVIVGGGAPALRRARGLIAAGAEVFVVAPQIDPDLAQLAPHQLRPYQPTDLDGAMLVVVATDDPDTNKQITHDARARNVLVNRCDDPAAGDLHVPAHAHHGPVTLAVHTGNISATAAVAIRRELSEALSPEWIQLLETIAPYRARIQQAVSDPLRRHDLLAQLASPEAMNILKEQGPTALEQFCRRCLSQSNESAKS